MIPPALSRDDTSLTWAQRLWRVARASLGRVPRGAMFSGFVTVAALTLLAKAVSFLKDAVVAHHFGTADELDAFMLAFSLLSFAAAMIGGGMPESFLPAFAHLASERGLRRAHRLGIQMTLCNLMVLGALGLVAYLAAPSIIAATGRGFDATKQHLAVHALRGLVPFFICFGVSFHLATWLRAQKRFFTATASPLVLPAFLIACLLVSGRSANLDTLVFGTAIGAALQVGWLGLTVAHDMPRPPRWLLFSLTHWEPRSRQVLHNALPFLLGGAIMGSSTMVDQAMAAWLEPGSVAVLGYSDKICGIVLALTAVPASEALFPFFAEVVARQDWPALRRQFLQAVGAVLLLAIPMMLMLVVCAPLVVRLLFERGAFHPSDTERVADVLRFAACQIPFYITGVLASRIVVSLQAARFLLWSSLGAMGVNVALNAWFMQYWGVAGIALSTVAVHLLSAGTLLAFVLTQISRRGGTRLPASSGPP